MFRSLTHFWRMSLAVVGGVAVTTAVLTGALLVGDSLRGSLRDLTLDRLGRTDLALLNQRFIPEELIDRLSASAQIEERPIDLVPVLLLSGSAKHPNSDRLATGIQVLGIDDRFSTLFPDDPVVAPPVPESGSTQIFPSVILNETLQEELGATIGDDVLLSLGRSSTIPSASPMGRREERDVLITLRLTVTGTLPTEGPGRFGLEARQTRPRNAYVDLTTLQKRLDRRAEVNLVLISDTRADLDHPLGPDSLEAALREALRLGDIGLELLRGEGWISIESAELVLRPGIADSVFRVAQAMGAQAWPYLTYLANSMEVGDRRLPYSTITALPIPIPPQLGDLVAATGKGADELVPGEILLNTWAAADLAAKPGDSLAMTYYSVGAKDELHSATSTFEVAGIVELESLGSDASLTPQVPGISDADNIAGWDPPFPVDLDLIGPRDESYWDRYRGAPKGFISLTDGQALWHSRFGRLTGIRLTPAPGTQLEAMIHEVERRLPRALALDEAGFQVLPVRTQGLEGASGTTDFAGLFLGFSLFLIVSAALLVALLFTLLVEQRSFEVGLLLATGYTVRKVRRRFMIEGGMLGLVGILFGTLLALGYTLAVLRGLAVWWSPVLDGPVLGIHAQPDTLLLGALATLIVVGLVTGRTVRRISKIPVRALLVGHVTSASTARKTRRASRLAWASLVLAGVMIALSLSSGMESTPVLFFGVGAALLIAGLSAFAAWAGRTGRPQTLTPRLFVPRLAARNSSRHLGRSLLSLTLVASASFILVSVSASRKTHAGAELSRSSGTGGFGWVAEAGTPLPTALDSSQDEAAGAIFNLRLRPGDDASCLNLYQPEQPRILGMPPEFVERAGFRFRSTLIETETPWALLHHQFEDGAIPAVGDYNSVRWILHAGLGQDILLDSDGGEPMRLRIVGLLDTSIFQSELLISERRFLENFPDYPGFGFFLGESPPAQVADAIAAVESRLAPFGLDAESAVGRLRGFQAVENMYLTTFEVLGGLGLMLGTVGLGLVLLRNTLERRGELATLRAFGFRRPTLAWMVVAENAFLLVVGLTIGSLSGLIAVAPYLTTGGIQVPWSSLALILIVVFLLGLASSVAAVVSSLRVPLLPALKAD